MNQPSLDSHLLAAAATSAKYLEPPGWPRSIFTQSIPVSFYPSTSDNFQLPASSRVNAFLFSSIFINSSASSERS